MAPLYEEDFGREFSRTDRVKTTSVSGQIVYQKRSRRRGRLNGVLLKLSFLVGACLQTMLRASQPKWHVTMSKDHKPEVALLGTYSLPSAVGVEADCFSQTFPIVLGSLIGKFTLPRITWADNKPRIVSPLLPGKSGAALPQRISQTQEDWKLFHFWGDVRSYNPATKQLIQSYVSAFLLSFNVDETSLSYSNYLYGRGHPQGELVASIFSEIDPWFDRVRTWIEVRVDQDLDPTAPLRHASMPGNGLCLLSEENDIVSLPATGSHIVASMSSDEMLTLPTFSQIITLSNRGELPSAVHYLIRDAHAAFRRKQYRRAVIDAGTATELSLSDFNRSSVHVTPPPNPTLGWYARNSIIATRAALPTNTVADLVEVRNKAIHENRVPTRSGALQTLQLAKSIVRRLDPLPIH